MRNLFRLLAIGFLLLGLSAPASSATLTLSGATLSLSIGVLPPVVVGQSPASLGGILVSSGGGSFSLPSGLFLTTQAIPASALTGFPLISGLTASLRNRTAMFHAGGGKNDGMGGRGPLQGAVFLNILNLFNLTVPLYEVGTPPYSSSGPIAGGLMVTVEGDVWTTGQTLVSNVTAETANTLSFTGFDNRTAGHAGVIRLVTPIRIVTSAIGTLGGFAAQTLTFLPEPGTLLLLGSCIVVLGAIGRRRLRR